MLCEVELSFLHFTMNALEAIYGGQLLSWSAFLS
jgi:hypothetical protein